MAQPHLQVSVGSTLRFINGSVAHAGPLKQLSNVDIIAQKRAEVAAKLASMKNAALGWTGPSIKAPVPKLPVPLPASEASSPSISSGPTPATGSPAPGLPASDDIARRVSEAKRRVAEAQSKLAVKDNPYMVGLFLNAYEVR